MAKGQADDVSHWHAESIEQPSQIIGEIADDGGTIGHRGPAMAAGVVAQAAVVRGQRFRLGVPHFQRGADRIGKCDDGRLLGAGQFVVQIYVVDGDRWH